MSGVASRNPFALLGDADDVAAASTPSAPKAETPVAPVKAKPTTAPTAARTNNRSTGGRGAPRGAAASRADGAGEGEQNRDVRERSARGRGESRGRGGAGRGGARGGRGRAFDRHSQTGKEDTEKKIAQGWGAQDGQTELAAEENGKADAAVEVAEGGEAAPSANGAPAAERPAPIPEEEDNTKTLDEYLAEQTAKRAQLGVAKAEGREINQSAWDKLQATKVDKSKTEEDYFAAKEKASKGPRARKEKQFVEIDTRFEAPASARGGREGGARGGRGGSERGGRGGRGGARGRGEGRGGARGGRGGASSGAAQVNLADQSAFPSLA